MLHRLASSIQPRLHQGWEGERKIFRCGRGERGCELSAAQRIRLKLRANNRAVKTQLTPHSPLTHDARPTAAFCSAKCSDTSVPTCLVGKTASTRLTPLANSAWTTSTFATWVSVPACSACSRARAVVCVSVRCTKRAPARRNLARSEPSSNGPTSPTHHQAGDTGWTVEEPGFHA